MEKKHAVKEEQLINVLFFQYNTQLQKFFLSFLDNLAVYGMSPPHHD